MILVYYYLSLRRTKRLIDQPSLLSAIEYFDLLQKDSRKQYDDIYGC